MTLAFTSDLYGLSNISKSSALGGTSSMTASQAMSYAMPIMALVGAVQSGLGTYYQSENLKSNLQYQSDVAAFNSRMSEINARSAERTAQSILSAGNTEAGRVSLKAGQVKGSQRASQGARGITIGEGNAAEEIATTDLAKEIDMLTINSNAVRAAWSARMAGVNAGTQAMNYAGEANFKNVSSDSINSFSSLQASLLGSASSVATSWFRMKQMKALSAIFGE